MNKKHQKPFPGVKNAGFTLIELLVVVLIIGILSSVALPQYTKAVEKARAAEAFTLMGTVRQASDVYMLSGQTASTSICSPDSSLDIGLPGTSAGGTECVTKHFHYDGDCNGAGQCRFRANRISGSTRHYSLHQQKNSSSTPWVLTCRVYTDTGWSVCNGLTSQGWTVDDQRSAAGDQGSADHSESADE